MNITAVK